MLGRRGWKGWTSSKLVEEETKGKKPSANVAEGKNSEKDEPENYAMAAFNLPDDPEALVCTSDFRSEAHAIPNHSESIIDSGASSHFSPECSKFLNYEEFSNSEPIRAADGHTFSALGKGDLKIFLPNGDQKPTLITLKNMLYSLHMAFTLISVSCVARAGFSLFIKGGTCIICSPTLKVIGSIPEIQELYCIVNTQIPHTANATVKQILINELHHRMGHVNHDDLQQMVEKQMVTGISLDMTLKPDFCETCVKEKAPCKPFPKESKMEYKAYSDKVVTDVWGPAPVRSIGGGGILRPLP